VARSIASMTLGTDHRVEVAPGRFVGWRTIGEGPGLVILHGAGRAARHYVELAEALGRRFAVHLVDRNGRGASIPRLDADGLTGQVADIVAVIGHVGADYLFGHSAGGLVALGTARTAPLKGLALYDPGVSIDGSFPTSLREEVPNLLEGNRLAEGFAKLATGVGSIPAGLPAWLFEKLIAAIFSMGRGRELRELLPLVAPDLRNIANDDGPPRRFSDISTPTLVIYGRKSPDFLQETALALVRALPRGTALPMDGFGHNAPDLTHPHVIAEAIGAAFSAGIATPPDIPAASAAAS